jgi:hypothetical protein
VDRRLAAWWSRESYPAPGPMGCHPTTLVGGVQENKSVMKPSCSSFEAPHRERRRREANSHPMMCVRPQSILRPVDPDSGP